MKIKDDFSVLPSEIITAHLEDNILHLEVKGSSNVWHISYDDQDEAKAIFDAVCKHMGD